MTDSEIRSRVLLALRREDARHGLSLSELRQMYLSPRTSATQVRSIVEQLQAEGLVTARPVRLANRSTPSLVYWGVPSGVKT